ncbi:MAG: molybdopterin-dependent oxidoreductase, partial [Isosphaeraceae bacterium]
IAASAHGPQAILPYSYYGTMGKLQASSLDRVFFHRLGASKLDRTICASAGSQGYEYTVGAGRFGADPMAVPGCRLIVNWGSNTVQTNAHLWSLMVDARRESGAKIITIDPYRSETAEKSDQHLRIRPGTDAALALGLMHVIFRDSLHDQAYLDDYCTGGESLKARVLAEYSPEIVAGITRLTTVEIETLARELATTQPSLIRLNYGLQRHFGGGMAVRTIACLPAVTGAWRHPGGGALLSTSGTYDFNMAGLTRPELVPAGTRTVNMNQLAEALAGELPGPPVMGLYVYNCNPAAVAPNQAKVLEGLKRYALFTVVHELFMTDSADYADIVLPATSQLEHADLHGSYGHTEVMLNFQSIEPLAEARSNNDVFRALAAEMQFDAELFPNDEKLMEIALRGGPHVREISVASLKEKPYQRLHLPEVHMPYQIGGFQTESGKCEIYSEAMKRAGLDPLPAYTPPAEDPMNCVELAAKYPIQMVSPPKGSFLNSTFAGSLWHRKRAGEPSLEMADEDAMAR